MAVWVVIVRVQFILFRPLCRFLMTKKKKALVFAVKPDERLKNIQIRVVQPFPSVPYWVDSGMIHDVGIVPLIVFVHYDGAINPHGKLIQKVALFVVRGLSASRLRWLRSIFAERPVPFLPFRLSVALWAG